MKITLETAQGWINRYGSDVDFCAHVTPETMPVLPELFGYSEFDSFGPVVIAVHCQACEKNMKQANAELGVTINDEPVVDYDYGQVHSWQDAYNKLLDLVLNDTVSHVAVASQADYHANKVSFQHFETIDAFNLLLSVGPRRFPQHPNFQLLCKWITLAGQQPFRALIVIPLRWNEKFVPVPDLIAK